MNEYENLQLIKNIYEEKNDFFKKLSEIEKQKYIYLTNVYTHCLIVFLNKKISLKNFDDYILQRSNLKYKTVKKEKMDIYQFLSSKYLNYFYIRNDIYIENLTQYEQNFLINLQESDYILKISDIIDFIESSFKKVIVQKLNKSQKKFFGPSDNLKYCFSTNEIILGFRYERFYENGGIDWNNEDIEKQNEKNNLISILKAKISKSNYNIKVVEYSDESVDTLKNFKS